jgi:hypothetical protein
MTANSQSAIMRVINRIGTSIDVFFSGVLQWRYCRWRAEKHLSRVLEHHGEQSMEARRATERFRELEFAVTFWRPAPRPVQQVILAAAASGVPVDALRLVALSRDLKAKGSEIVLRRSRLLSALSIVMAGIVFLEWAELCAVILLQHGHIALKCVVLLVVTTINWVMWRGWSLWCGRPERVVKRWGALLEQSCKSVQRSTATPLSLNKPRS